MKQTFSSQVTNKYGFISSFIVTIITCIITGVIKTYEVKKRIEDSAAMHLFYGLFICLCIYLFIYLFYFFIEFLFLSNEKPVALI